MSKIHPGLTLEEHEELGRKLVAMCDEMQAIQMQLSYAYPLNKGVYQFASKANKYLDMLRARLDDFVYAEHRKEFVNGKNPNHVYYPRRSEAKP